MTKKTIEQKLNEELLEAEDIIAEFEYPEVELIEDNVQLNTRKERGLAPRINVVSNAVTGDIHADYEYARDNLYNLVEKGNEALDGILELAKEMEHPRAYEVASGLIKSVTDTTMELMKMQEKLMSLKGESKTGSSTTNNNLYVGSTAELQALLKGKDMK